MRQANIERYKKQAQASIEALEKNPNGLGVSCVAVAPHDLLEMLAAVEPKQEPDEQA